MNMSFYTCIAGALAGLLALPACVQPLCAQPDYREAECRVLAENERARLRAAPGAELRFHDPRARDTASWDALGLLRETSSRVSARVAAPGDFALSITPRDSSGAGELELELLNVDPRLNVTVTRVADDAPVAGAELALAADGEGLTRRATIPMSEGALWIRGQLPCPERFRIAAVGDVQDGVAQFARILDRLALEREQAEEAGEPLLGLLLLGDLSDRAEPLELDELRERLDHAPVPVATTPGNHDVFRELEPAYTSRFGPGTYSFELCRARVAMLDTASGALADSVEGRLDELVARDRERLPFLLVGTHYPAYAGLTGNGWSREEQAQHLLVTLAGADVDLLLTGHIHALREFASIPTPRGPVRELVVGTGGASQGSGPLNFGYLRATFTGATLRTCFVEVPPPGGSAPQGAQPIPTCN